MAKRQKNPSKAGVSAASVKGDAGPKTREQFGKTQSTNNQYGAENTQEDQQVLFHIINIFHNGV